MPFILPKYHAPYFAEPPLADAPLVEFRPAPLDGVAPDNYHATSIYPEYFQTAKGTWKLLEGSRMDCAVVREPGASLEVKEFRRLKAGEPVACGRRENGEDGIFVNTGAFGFSAASGEKFAFRTRITRETSFSIDYDELFDLLDFERRSGSIVWVLGPAVVFDRDARAAFVKLVEEGYVHALLAGNALAVHDVEAAFFETALGQGIYSKRAAVLGHYNHLDAINRIRKLGSLERAVRDGKVKDGVMRAVIARGVPFVLAGSIRDDGPLPEVIANVYEAQDRMRSLVRNATTVIALATQLHAIATGNMAPSYKVTGPNQARPVYFYAVDMSEFAVSKLADRGSLTARSVLTNVQDFIVTLERGLARRCG